MKILVIGSGSIGRRHVRNLKELFNKRGDGEVFVFDVNEDALEFAAQGLEVRTCNDLDKALAEADGVLVCTPNHLHASLALKAVQNDCHVLVENPLAHSFEHVDELLAIAKQKNLTVTVGYMLRFYEPLLIVKRMLEEGRIGKVYGARIEFGSFLPSWRPTQDYRNNYGAIRAQGGGVILDVIHEINYARWLFGSVLELFCIAGKQSNLEMDTEDFAEITMRCENNVVVNMHFDYLQKDYSRSCKIIGEKGLVIWDFIGHKVKFYDNETGTWQITTNEKMDFNKTYVAEVNHFLDCVSGAAKPLVSGEEAKEDLKVALAALESAEKKQVVRFHKS